MTESGSQKSTEKHSGAAPVSGSSAAETPGPKKDNFFRDLLAPVAGFGVTFGSMFRPTVTEQYPFEKVPTQPRYHGRHQLNRHPDGLEKCIGCELCAWVCPADAIFVEGADNQEGAQFSPGERYGRVYQINYLRCIFCALCIEACPTRALTMTNEYELAGPTRAGLIYEKDQLLAPLEDHMLPAPHPMVPGTTDQDYYNGEVTGVVGEQVDWVRENRPEEPALENFEGVTAHGQNSQQEAAKAHAAAPQPGSETGQRGAEGSGAGA